MFVFDFSNEKSQDVRRTWGETELCMVVGARLSPRTISETRKYFVDVKGQGRMIIQVC